MSDTVKFAKSNQEQAVAAWVGYLNQLRLGNLLSALSRRDVNLRDALASIDEALMRARLEVVDTNLGGIKGMHGFIAEVAEVGIANARSQVLGKDPSYQWVNDNGPVDLVRAGVAIQQKFSALGGHFSLPAVTKHFRMYPNFVANGGKYQVPRDDFEVIKRLYEMSPVEAGKVLTRSGEGPSFSDWEWVQSFFADGNIPFESLEPSTLAYDEVQRGAYEATLDAEKESLRSTDQSLRDQAHRASRPTLQEGAKVTLTATALEGGTSFVRAVVEKRRTGKRLQEFTADDWNDVVADTGFGLAKGGIRGVSLYTLTNFVAAPAAVANSVVTAAFGVAEQANKLRRGEIGELEFIENAELVALEAAVSALSSLVGQMLIPVPVLGAVIGNTVGTVMYQSVSSSLSKREAELIGRHFHEQRVLDEKLAADYQELIDQLDETMADYLEVLERAFSPDVEVALLGSVELALALGVASDEILDTDEKSLAYFLD